MKEYNSPAANEYADLMSMIEDLHESSRHFSLAEEKMKARRGCDEIRGSWIAGVILYGRVFGGGVRSFDWNQIVAKMRDDMKVFHSWLIDMRNKHIAHSVNLHEDAFSVVNRCNGTTEVGHLIVSFSYPEENDLKQFKGFVDEVAQIANSFTKGLQQAFTCEAEQLSDAQINALPVAEYKVPGPTGAKQSRQRS